MSRLPFWWRHYRRHANPPKTIMSPLYLSPFLSLAQTYWSGIQITEAKRSLSRGWRRDEKGKKYKACTGENGEKMKENGEKERNCHKYFGHAHYLPLLSWNGWNDFQTSDVGINTDTHVQSLMWERTNLHQFYYVKSTCLCETPLQPPSLLSVSY